VVMMMDAKYWPASRMANRSSISDINLQSKIPTLKKSRNFGLVEDSLVDEASKEMYDSEAEEDRSSF
jgi:hypothetical protein